MSEIKTRHKGKNTYYELYEKGKFVKYIGYPI